MMSGYRATQKIREWDGFGVCSKLKFSFHGKLSRRNHHFRLKTRRFFSSSACYANGNKKVALFPLLLVNCLQSKTPADLPALPNCLSQREEDHELSSEGLASIQGGVVALGKFDALHIGHRELAIQASSVGAPFLLSFVGMAEVLGWEPRAPIVAKCDRERVLSSWASFCGNVAPKEFLIEFSSVRHLSPQQFVEKLSRELGIRGVVAGQNYRFGYRASGTASDLVRLCNEYGIEAYIIDSVMDKTQILGNSYPEGIKERGQVSSTRVRYALANGDISYVKELLGRPHRVILFLGNKEGIFKINNRVSVPRSCLLNLPPKDGLYRNCFVIIGDGARLQCVVRIDSERIHLDLDDVGLLLQILDETRLLGVEFGE